MNRKARRRPGRPVTTGSDATPPVNFRVSAAQRVELEAEGRRRGIGPNQVAKLRAFPVG